MAKDTKLIMMEIVLALTSSSRLVPPSVTIFTKEGRMKTV